MAPIGTVIAKLKLDKTDISGPDDIVSGTVILEYCPASTSTSKSASTGSELFGPLRLSVILDGLLKLRVDENRTSHAYIWFYERRNILQKRELIFDGAFRAPALSPQLFRFSTQMRTGVQRANVTALPPTFRTHFAAYAIRQAGQHQGSASVEYSVRVDVELPGIEVEIASEAPPSVIRYEQASRSPQGFVPGFTESMKVQTYGLLPEDERPTNLLDTTRAILKNVSKPISVFNATCSKLPASIAVGEKIRIEVRLQFDSNASTAAFIPDVVLGNCVLEIFSRTQLYATNQKGVDSPHLDDSRSFCKLVMIAQTPSGPFGKSNDFSKMMVFAPLYQDTPSSFTTEKLTRTYRGLLALQFIVANQTVSMKKKFLVEVLPPRPPTADGTVEAGPSRSIPMFEDLPSYAEAQTARA